MTKTYLWQIIPLNQPTVIKNCPKCRMENNFISTGCFRINANKNKVDIWLIYQCQKCKATWNMTILSRVNPSGISQELYQKFLKNDQDLACYYAFDASIHSLNNTKLNFSLIEYEIKGEFFDLKTITVPVQIHIKSPFAMDIRADRILNEKLGISKSQIKKLWQEKLITGLTEKEIWKEKLSKELFITFYPN